MKNKILLIISAFLLVLGLISFTSAFGISVGYWDIEPARPLQLAPGETKIVNINLQNNLDENDVNVKAKMILGKEIASFEDKTYTIKGKTSDMMIPLRVEMPKDAQPGEKIKIVVEFISVTGHEGGMITMGTGMGISFDALVTGEPVQESPIDKLPWGAIGIIAVIIILGITIVILVIRRRNIVGEQERLTNFK